MANVNDAKKRMEDIKNQLSLLLFNEQTLIREIELLRPKIESKIVQPKRMTNLKNLKQDDLNIDVVPASLADMETIKSRKAFFYANRELADVVAEIEAKKEMYNSYKTHMMQEFEKESKPLTDETIFDAYHKLQGIKNMGPEEKEAAKNIGESMPKMLNSGKKARIELYETIQNLIRQHS